MLNINKIRELILLLFFKAHLFGVVEVAELVVEVEVVVVVVVVVVVLVDVVVVVVVVVEVEADVDGAVEVGEVEGI